MGKHISEWSATSYCFWLPEVDPAFDFMSSILFQQRAGTHEEMILYIFVANKLQNTVKSPKIYNKTW